MSEVFLQWWAQYWALIEDNYDKDQDWEKIIRRVAWSGWEASKHIYDLNDENV